MTERRKPRVYEEGPQAARNFEGALGRILTVSKDELERREAAHQEANRNKPRRGRRPSHSEK